MLSYLIGIPLGIIGAFVVLILMTRHNHGAEPLHVVALHDPETLDQQWREIWNNGFTPVWSDQLGWIADGPSVIEKVEQAAVPKPVMDKVIAQMIEQGGVRVTRMDTADDFGSWIAGGAFAHVPIEDLQALKADMITQFDHLYSRPEVNEATMQRAQGLADDLDLIKAELVRRLVQRDATGKVVIDDVR